jgi:hypothetical protein
VELYFYSPIRLHGVVLSYRQGLIQLYLHPPILCPMWRELENVKEMFDVVVRPKVTEISFINGSL